MKTPIKVWCPRCGWSTFATWWEVDRTDDGMFYPIIVCPKCYSHVELIFN